MHALRNQIVLGGCRNGGFMFVQLHEGKKDEAEKEDAVLTVEIVFGEADNQHVYQSNGEDKTVNFKRCPYYVSNIEQKQ